MIKTNSVKSLKYIVISIMLLLSMYMLTGCELLKNDSKKDDEEKRKIEAYEERIDNIVNGLANADSELFLSAFPDFIAVHMQDVYNDDFLEGYAKIMKDEYGNNVKITFKVTEKSDIEADNLRKMEQEMKDNFDKEFTITNGYKLKVDITTKGEKAEDTKDDNL